jgi:hypothetical protein
MTANRLAFCKQGLFFIFGEYTDVEEVGFQNNFEVN